MKTRIYTLNVDSNLDAAIKNFENQLNDYEEIVSTNTVCAEGCNKLVIITRELPNKNRNLLIEDLTARNLKKMK